MQGRPPDPHSHSRYSFLIGQKIVLHSSDLLNVDKLRSVVQQKEHVLLNGCWLLILYLYLVWIVPAYGIKCILG
jgi:hypothetical protein